jgi:phospholipid-binding lipoprotein MlaA
MPRSLLSLILVLAAGCAGTQPPRPDYDPWESFNRKIFSFNDWVDVHGLEPVARGWNYVMPDRVQQSFVSFFDNVRFPIVVVNDLLQGRPRAAVEAVARFQINTFMGGLGFYDLAAYNGLPLQQQDTGQTLGRWGIATGPYLVLPLLGPSNPRDTAGLVGDAGLGFYTYFITIPGLTVGASVIDIVNRRARLLDTIERAKEASLDYYIFVRNAFVQRRYRLIHDERPAGGAEQEELYDAEVYEENPADDQ